MSASNDMRPTPLLRHDIVGESRALRDALKRLVLVARTDATVLIFGESGTGKELFAREIHARSERAGQRLVKVNCSAVPYALFESEFFGHKRGAFTGALHDRPGRFELADGGTIFLDEVGDLPLDLQPKLLRVLEERQYERVGEDTTRCVDVRVIAATNRDLAAEVRAGRFRDDLYYRLSVFPIEVPPLRARREDIALLVATFVASTARKLGIPERQFSERQSEELKDRDWPGNVRELQNAIERAVILSADGPLRLDLPAPDWDADILPDPALERRSEPIVPAWEWRRRERDNLVAALERSGGRVYGQGGAAELLGVRPSTLQSQLKSFGIRGRKPA